MLFFLLDLVFWHAWSLLVWSIQYLGPLILLIQLIRLIRADADLSLLMYERFGMMPSSMRGKVVWITGASSGIGEQLAYVLTKAGCKLVLSARRKEELDRVKQACVDMPGYYEEKDFMVLPMDVLEFDSHPKYVKQVIDYFGKCDILVNNAARGQMSLIKDTTIETDRAMVELVVLAQVSLTKAILPHFIERQAGHIVITSSILGKIAIPNMAGYCLGKFAIQGFFEALRMEHARDNIQVTLCCPGPVVTNFYKEVMTGEKGVPPVKVTSSMAMMTGERCAELMAVAMANKSAEAWIVQQPMLAFVYLGQYMPDCFRWISRKSMTRMVEKLNEIQAKE